MIAEISPAFVCVHCQSKFTKEKTLMIHMCEQKRRHLAKNEKHVILGFYTFKKFYEINQKTNTKSLLKVLIIMLLLNLAVS